MINRQTTKKLLSTSMCLSIGVALLAQCPVTHAQFEFGDSTPVTVKQPWQNFKLNPRTRVKLDFRNANIDAVLHVISKASGITIIKDPSLTGGFTLQSPTPQNLDDAFSMLNAALGMRNFEIIKEGNFLEIKPKSQRGGGGRGGFGGFPGGFPGGFDPSQMGGFGGRGGSNSELRVYQLKYANATTLARVINDIYSNANQNQNQGGFPGFPGFPGAGGQPGGQGGGGRRGNNSPNVKASADDYSNAIVVNASRSDQDQVQQIISQIDKPTEQAQKTKVFILKYAIASDVVSILQNVMSGTSVTGRGSGTQNQNRGGGGGGGGPFGFFNRFGGGGNNNNTNGTVIADAHTNSVIVTATDIVMAQVEPIIDKLDVSIATMDSTFIIPLKNSRADVVAQIINSTFGKSGSSGINTSGQVSNRTVGSSSSSGSSSGPANLRTSTNQSSSSNFSVQASSITSRNSTNGSASSATLVQGITGEGAVVSTRDLNGLVTAVPDVNTNSVIIVSPPEGRKLVENIIAQLDRMPQQVMIETIVVDATLDATNSLGVEWGFNQNSIFGQKNESATGASSFGLQPAAGKTATGFSYTISGTKYSAFVNALKTDKRFEILSTPRIFTTNNAQAEINISQSVPYQTSQTTDTNGATTSNYSFVTVGLVLNVTPRILSNGLVSMDVTQTANDIAGYTTYNAPIINQREADTTVSVRDGETIVLGGIISHTKSSDVKKTPILGDIPLIGNLFKSSSKSTNKTELLVLLTPRIVSTADQMKKMLDDNKADLAKPTQDHLKEVGPSITNAAPLNTTQ